MAAAAGLRWGGGVTALLAHGPPAELEWNGLAALVGGLFGSALGDWLAARAKAAPDAATSQRSWALGGALLGAILLGIIRMSS